MKREGKIWGLILFSLLVGSSNGFEPLKIRFEEFMSEKLSLETGEELKNALENVGVFVVNEIPGFENIAEETLKSASGCVQIVYPELEKEAVYTFADGTQRFTLATERARSYQEPSTFASMDFEHIPECKNFNQGANSFRVSFDRAIKAFGLHLDDLFQERSIQGRGLLFDTEKNAHQETFSEVFENAIEIEHFHSYKRLNAKKTGKLSNEPYTLDVHTDQGLFIALHPALYLSGPGNLEGKSGGFYIKLRTGEVVQPSLKRGEIVFMLGDGFPKWLNHNLDARFRAVPHAMAMPRIQLQEDVVRSWYGRMILPKHSATVPFGTDTRTMGEIRELVQSFAQEATKKETWSRLSTSLCSPAAALDYRLLQEECQEGTIFCWLSCQDISSTQTTCASNEEVLCTRTNDENVEVVCPEDSHLQGFHDCGLSCFSTEASNSDNGQLNSTTLRSNGFCSGTIVSMYMEGFTNIGDPDTDCVVVFFDTFVLDSPGMFAVGCLFSIAFGVFTEFIVLMRKKVGDMDDANSPKAFEVTKVFLYGVQQACGYLAMFIAMTYSVILFIMIVLGLTLGHVMFNFPSTNTNFTAVSTKEVSKEQQKKKKSLEEEQKSLIPEKKVSV